MALFHHVLLLFDQSIALKPSVSAHTTGRMVDPGNTQDDFKRDETESHVSAARSRLREFNGLGIKIGIIDVEWKFGVRGVFDSRRIQAVFLCTPMFKGADVPP